MMEPEHERNAPQTKQPRWGFRGKTIWNWLEVLIVPLVLVVIGFLFTVQQDARQQQIEDQRAQQAQKLENRRAEAERELAEQSAQDEALQAYLDQMSTLMLEKNLRNSDEDSEVRTLAQARTTTVIRRLDTSRKDEIMNFLVNADLVSKIGESAPVIKLAEAPLRNVQLRDADLHGANLRDANLHDAILQFADLHGATLIVADLREDFLDAADLGSANLSYARLDDASLNDADLRGADLDNADLTGANLIGANLTGANLHGATLDKANLDKANLKYADGSTGEQLMAAKSLKGATMPNGQKYEDWLKSKDSGG